MLKKPRYAWRLLTLVLVLCVAFLGLICRIIYLGVIRHDFLLDQSNMRSVRDITIPVQRGMIVDRNGEPLAISVVVASVWVQPKLFIGTLPQKQELAKMLDMSVAILDKKITSYKNREFVYLKRAIPQKQAEQILNKRFPGVFLERGYKRYYPEAEATAHVIGFTNVDNHGQEGLELAYNQWLHGVPGKQRVVKDRFGNIVDKLGVVVEPQEGRNLVLSIDKRIQYLAYNELCKVLREYHAESGSVVVLAAKTGEVLAMVNAPSYDPNQRVKRSVSNLRNRAVTDLYEPGSTIKTFSVINALNSGKYHPQSLIDSNPGVFNVEGHLIYDNNHVNNGVLTVTKVLQKSSDIGVAKMTLALPSDSLMQLLQSVGFGQSTQSGFPGEVTGVLPNNLRARKFVLATLSFGYSIAVTPLQLAVAHAVIASRGILRPVTFLKTEKKVEGQQVLAHKVCQQMLEMLEKVLDIGGTGKRARIPGYRVAGKTGTAHIASPRGGYYKNRYFANFVGIAPVSDPELVIVVVIKNPQGFYHGGRVAAPAFANIMNGALRILSVPLDAVESI